MNIDFEERVKDVQPLHTSKRAIGIPVTLFAFCIGLGLLLASMVRVWIGVFMAAMSLFVLYEIYKDDPNALFVIMRRLRMRFTRGVGGKKPRRKIKIITE